MNLKGFSRHPRYEIEGELKVLARPFGMKFYNFELRAINVSMSGVLVRSSGKGFIPFDLDGIIICTFDIHAAFFERPIHLTLKVVRAWESNGIQFFGAKMIHIESHEKAIFERDIEKLKRLDQVSEDDRVNDIL